jgi:hypothetical protein
MFTLRLSKLYNLSVGLCSLRLQLNSNSDYTHYASWHKQQSDSSDLPTETFLFLVYCSTGLRMRRRSASGSLDRAGFLAPIMIQCGVGVRLIGQETHYVSLE